MKKSVLFLLSKIASLIIQKHKPFVVGITGTVGKTTATNFVYEFLSHLYPGQAYKSQFDYNGEFGLPLTILQSKSPNKNIFLWIAVFLKGIYLYLSSSYPKYLVLEYGIDRKDEMEFLTSIVSPDVGIILNISANHITQFPDYNDYINEKTLLGKSSKKVIYNADDKVLSKVFGDMKDSVAYSIDSNSAYVRAKNIHSTVDRLSFEVSVDDEKVGVEYNLIGSYQVNNILPVFALGKTLNLSLVAISEILGNVKAQKGRGTLLKGINESIIIDGSYNGGFLSISSGVKYINNLEGDYNKVLFLGDMRELGVESKKLHSELASMIDESRADYVILVGDEMKTYVYDKLNESNFKDRVFTFKSSRLAGDKVREIIQTSSLKSVVFVKGSQNTIFLEEGVKKILFNMQDISNLCRQSPYWMSIKEDFFSHIL